MKKLIKKTFIIFMALVLAFGTLTAVVFAQDNDPIFDTPGHMSFTLKAYRYDESVDEYVETTRAKPGEQLKIRVFIENDFYASTCRFVTTFDSEFFRSAFNTNKVTQNGSSFMYNSKYTPKLDTSDFMFLNNFEKGSNSYNVNTGKWVRNGLVDQGFFDNIGLYVVTLGFISSNGCRMFNSNDWVVSYDVIVRDDVLEEVDGKLVPVEGRESGKVDIPSELLQPNCRGTGVEIDAPTYFDRGEELGTSFTKTVSNNSWDSSIDCSPAAISVFSNVVLDANGGHYPDRQTEKSVPTVIGEKAVIPTDIVPKMKSYDFIGWSTSSAEGSDVLSAEALADIEVGYDDVTLYAQWKEKETIDLYDASFYADGEIFSQKQYEEEDVIVVPDAPEKEGYEFVGWTPEVPYYMPASDVSFTAEYEPITYYVTFVADGVEIAKVPFDAENMTVELPEKPGYICKSETINLGYSDITVNVTYEPITYYVTFVADGEEIAKVPFDAENMTVELPEKPGYVCKSEVINLGYSDMTVNVTYEPITYYATFVAGGEEIAKIPFNAENMSVEAPEVPERSGYTGKWEQFTLAYNDITVNAVYDVVTYYATFVADGEVIAKNPFDAENMSVEAPEIPEKAGFTGAWENYNLAHSDITVNAVYTANKYEAVLMADGQIVEIIPYTYGQKSISLPKVPEKIGYTGEWSSYSLGVGGTTIHATYTINKYQLKFVANGNTITSENVEYGASITAPQAPEINGYTFKEWSPSVPTTMPAADSVFTAIYEKDPVVPVSIEINTLPSKTTYRYKETKNPNLSGLSIKVNYSDGSSEIITDTSVFNISGFNTGKPVGKKTVTVEYEGLTAEFNVNVKYVWWQWIIRILLLGFIWY